MSNDGLGMTTTLRTDVLTEADLPSASAGWEELATFALTWGAYREIGTSGIVLAIARSIYRVWDESGELPVSMEVLRTALFGYQRNVNWSEGGPSEDDLAYMAVLIRQMRTLITDCR